jgi:hypothetical protein
MAMTILVLTCGAKAYDVHRIYPSGESCGVAQGEEGIFVAHFSIDWPGLWQQLEWYVDGKLKYRYSPGQQTDFDIGFAWVWYTPGTYEIKVRAQYSIFGLSAWTDYLTWSVSVYAHPPDAVRVSPESPVTLKKGQTQAFVVLAGDLGGDLRGVRWYLDGVLQGDFPLSGGEDTHTWSYTFDVSGTYLVEAVAFDEYDALGSVKAVWTVVVESGSRQARLTGMVVELGAGGQAKGALAGAKVSLTGVETAITGTTDAQGKFTFDELNPGTYAVNVSKKRYYAARGRDVSLAPGETQDHIFQLSPESRVLSAFDFASPGGKHFVEGLPGNLSFSVMVAWNGSPGSVCFNVAGTSHAATIMDLGAGKTLATLTIPVPATIPERSEVEIEAVNGEKTRVILNMGVYLHPVPPIVQKWFTDVPIWEVSERTLHCKEEVSRTLWDIAPKLQAVSSSAGLGIQNQLSYDPRAGTFTGSIRGSGKTELGVDVSQMELLSEGRIDLTGGLAITLAGYDAPTITPSWKLSFSGEAGVEADVVDTVSIVIPPAADAMAALRRTPIVRDLVRSLAIRLYLSTRGVLSGEYESWTGDCFLGATSASSSLTLGLGSQVALALRDAEAGVYAGVMGTPEFQFCPDFQLQGVTLRGYVGVFASAWVFRVKQWVGVLLRWGPNQQQDLLAIASIPGSSPGGGWQPIGDSCLLWGPMNVLADETGSGGRLRILSAQGEVSEETRLVENVVSLASPVLLSGPSERLILFSLHDPNKPWYAATDIGTLRQKEDQPWALDRITDDQAAEFGPSIVGPDPGTALAAWERVSGDIADTNEPGQIAPHMEIVAASFDPNTGLWSTPQQLTSNTVADHQPMPIALGTMRGILWIQNEGGAAIGDARSGDRLMFVKWSGNKWDEPQTLWSAKKGLLDYAFVADGLGEGHVVLAVDEDGDPNTTADCELYLLSTANGAWQAATQLTSDFAEDAMPVLVAPNGVATCVWSADKTLVYSQLGDWNPREVYKEYTLANEAPSLAGVTMPGGAAIAYTVQGPNGVDIVASFYDADLDCWSLPRQLTNDEHAESSLSLTCDANELAIAYLKTQTVRTPVDVEIEGQMQRLENVPQPGRTDLYVLRHALANDLAVVSDSMVVEPANPAPGTAATIRATIENRGDLPLQDVVAVFYDGDPSNGGVIIGDRQVIAGTMIAGGKKALSVSWKVPRKESSHRVFVVVDPCLAVEDRDRSNNMLSLRTVLPDLAIETCWSTEVSSTMMALTARIVNKGVITAGEFDLSWHLGSPDGEEIGTGMIEPLIAGGAHEVTFLWDTTGRLDPGQHAQVFAVVDSAGSVSESDETNNAYSLAVFHPPVVSPPAP